MYDLDFAKSELLYKTSLELGDRTRWGYAILLGSIGKVEEAIGQYQLGLLNDPLALGMKFQLARMLTCARRYEESINHYNELLEEMPDITPINAAIADMYLQLGETWKAEQLLARFPEYEADPSVAGPILAKLGMTAKAEAALEAMESGEEWMAEPFVRTALLLGQEDRALEYLLRAAQAEPRSLTRIQCHSDVVALADEPRYQQALDVVGFPPQYRRAATGTRRDATVE
jgi:tetratricopeptide (TPR) repeat protein